MLSKVNGKFFGEQLERLERRYQQILPDLMKKKGTRKVYVMRKNGKNYGFYMPRDTTEKYGAYKK